MGIADDVQAWFDQQYQSQVSQLESWWETTTHHGCFCGAGSRCSEPVDDLDRLCQQHDADYGAAGVSAETMWSADGFARSRDADYALAVAAGAATTESTEYRERLIWLFTTRYQIADAVLWYREQARRLEEYRQQFREWLLSANTLPPAEQRQQLEQWLQVLEREGVDRYQAEVLVAESGFRPDETGESSYA